MEYDTLNADRLGDCSDRWAFFMPTVQHLIFTKGVLNNYDRYRNRAVYNHASHP